MDDPSRMRIADSDRHKVADLLRDAAGEGRLEFDELDERLEATYAAKVYADLVPITADLPAQGVELAPPAAPVRRAAANVTAPRPNSSFPLLGGQDRRGVWEAGETHPAFSMMVGIELDVPDAVFPAPETPINATPVLGGDVEHVKA